MNDTTIIILVGFFVSMIAIVTPIVKLNTTITKLNVTVENINCILKEVRKNTLTNSAGIVDLNKKYDNHEYRIGGLEKKGESK